MDAVEARDADDDQIDCYDIIQQPREEQNQNAGDQRNADGEDQDAGVESNFFGARQGAGRSCLISSPSPIST